MLVEFSFVSGDRSAVVADVPAVPRIGERVWIVNETRTSMALEVVNVGYYVAERGVERDPREPFAVVLLK